jgi:phosphomevalonate kinase
MHTFLVPGKLMLSGEWNILTPGRSCITLPTKGIHVSIEPADFICITSPAYKLSRITHATLMREQNSTALFLTTMITAATTLVRAHKIMLQPFHITLENDPQTFLMKNNVVHKLGVGSSACTAVGIIKAIALFHDITLSDEELFKHAALGHYQAQNKLGSGFDIAAAAAGKPIIYTSYDTSQVSIETQTRSTLKIKPISLPSNWLWAVGFSGKSANTPELIKIFKTAQEKDSHFEESLRHIEAIVQSLAAAIEQNNIVEAMKQIQKNQHLLDILSELCGNVLTTVPLKQMIDLATAQGAAAKFSGAGGGDCVIALCPTQDIKNNVYAAWDNAGFMPVDELLNHANSAGTNLLP